MFVSHVSVDWWLKFCAGNWKVEGLSQVWVDSWAETVVPLSKARNPGLIQLDCPFKDF